MAIRPSSRPRRLILAALIVCSTLSLSSAVPDGAAAESVVVGDRVYDAYIPAATKQGQFAHYTCEFDAAWVVLKTFGYDVGLEEQLAIVGFDQSVEPWYQETTNGVVIYGGDVTTAFSGNYHDNFLARTTSKAMRKLFNHFDLDVKRVGTQKSLERELRAGKLVWIKTTVDFLPWTPATWVMPNGESYQTVLGNDHSVVVMGFNDEVVVIRDVLGPTSSNWNRVYEYEVDWETFMWAWGAHGKDGLAVGLPAD